jgi:hypothetical protein
VITAEELLGGGHLRRYFERAITEWSAAQSLDRLERLIDSLETLDDAPEIAECLRP